MKPFQKVRLLAVGIIAALGYPSAQTRPQFKATVTGVAVHVVVRTGGQPVRGLQREDFALKDNGVDQEVLAIEASEVPLDITLVVQETVQQEKFSIGTFQAEMAAISKLVGASDQLRLILAGDDQREVPFPLDRDLRIGASSAWTCRPVYDALARALMRPTENDRHHVVVLISVGEGTGSFLSMSPVEEIARRSTARLYVVSVERVLGGTSYRSHVLESPCSSLSHDWSPDRRARLRQIEATPSATMQRRQLWIESKNRLVEIAKLTGGSEIHPTILTQSMTEPIRRALADFRTGYLLRYSPRGVPETGWHPVEVKVKRVGRYDVRARPGFER